jgi:hypothetical protein
MKTTCITNAGGAPTHWKIGVALSAITPVKKETFYKIVKSTTELIYRCVGVQVARRAPCASHTAEPAGGIALKCPPDQQMLEPGESVDRFQI